MIAHLKEVQEVHNAIKAYEAFQQWQPSQEKDLLQAHQVLMTGLIDEVGQYRHSGVGVCPVIDSCIWLHLRIR